MIVGGSAEVTGKSKLDPRAILLRRELVVFVPAVALAGLWFGLQAMMLLGLTALIVAWMTRPIPIPEDLVEELPDLVTGLPQRTESEGIMQMMISDAASSGRSTACLVVGIDEARGIARQMTAPDFDMLQSMMGARLRGALRESDRVGRLDEGRFAVMLTPTTRPDLEGMIQLAARLQSACEAPYAIAARSFNFTCHVGFCLMSRAPETIGTAMIAAAEAAAAEASRNGPSAIRAFSNEIRQGMLQRSTLASEFTAALEAGQIVAYFQPQVCTDTGVISGMQAVPRWLHRERGVLTEAEILPAVDGEGRHQRLAEVMLYQSFHALREWERLPAVPGPVSLALPLAIAADPRLGDRLKWEFDRFDIAPERLRFVLPQDVTAQLNEEVISRNVTSCKQLGCQIELADFGAAPTSVSAIRRSGAGRVRVHRSFVTHVDRDPEQQRLVAAIVSFAEGLGLSTLAEGVATLGEHAMLAQLGCNNVQGKAISAPMPLDETFAWLTRHQEKLAVTPRIGHRRGA